MAKKKEASKEGDKKKSPLEEAGFSEEIEEETNIMGAGEEFVNDYTKTGWPKPLKRLRLVFESYNASIEETYFWVLNHTKQDQAYNKVIKVTDTFTASENSSFWGTQAQRLGIQQDKVSQYMALIGKMTKELFQIVREIRILKERLTLYHQSLKGVKSADMTLKDYWAGLVEGGSKNPGSIYGLQSQLGFQTLPDLFFGIPIKPGDNVENKVDAQAGKFNEKVKTVLTRKLKQYQVWFEQTKGELETRHKFTLRYLRQHWNAIRMYMNWVKPYLKNVQRLSTEEKYRDSEELISAMEGAIMEIEFLARRQNVGGFYPVILAHFLYRVRPAMNFNTSDYQRGPIHVGRVTVTLRAYAWTEKQIANYLKYRQDEDLDLLSYVDGSVEAAMDALGDELQKYLEEAEEEAGLAKKEEPDEDAEKEKNAQPNMNIFEPFAALAGGFKEIATMVIPFPKKKKKGAEDEVSGPAPKGVCKSATATMWQVYKNYKKAHQMLSW